jgi:hypothetical protein
LKPCPLTFTTYSEVLFKIGNKIYALYDGGPNQDRLVELPDGNYVTTDGRNCHFTISGGNLLWKSFYFYC